MVDSAVVRGSAGSEWRSGWPLVTCATIGVAVAGMHYPVMGAIMQPLTQEYGWTRGEAALGLSITSLLSPIANVLVGITADRFGPRPVVLAGTLAFTISYALFGLTGPDLMSFYLVSALFALCGYFAGPIVLTMAVVRWFSVSRGLALALTLSGSGIMASFMPTIVLALLEEVGLRATFVVLAVGGGLLMFVPSYFLFRDPGGGTTTSASRRASEAALPGLSVAQTLSGTRFWRLAAALLVVSATVGMFLLHFQSMLIDTGMSPGQAASVALVIGPAMIVGRLGTGLLFDRLPARLVAGCAFGVLTVASVLLLGFDGSMMTAFIIAAIIGLGIGAELDVVAYLTSRYFGLRRYGALFGLLMGVYGLGLGAGSAAAGWVFDNYGSYDLLLITLGAGCIVAALLAVTLGNPDVPERPEQSPGPEAGALSRP